MASSEGPGIVTNCRIPSPGQLAELAEVFHGTKWACITAEMRACPPPLKINRGTLSRICTRGKRARELKDHDAKAGVKAKEGTVATTQQQKEIGTLRTKLELLERENKEIQEQYEKAEKHVVLRAEKRKVALFAKQLHAANATNTELQRMLCEDVEAVEADEETQETQGPEKPDGLKMLSHINRGTLSRICTRGKRARELKDHDAKAGVKAKEGTVATTQQQKEIGTLRTKLELLERENKEIQEQYEKAEKHVVLRAEKRKVALFAKQLHAANATNTELQRMLCEDVEAVEADEETQETQGPEKPDGLKMLSHINRGTLSRICTRGKRARELKDHDAKAGVKAKKGTVATTQQQKEIGTLRTKLELLERENKEIQEQYEKAEKHVVLRAEKRKVALFAKQLHAANATNTELQRMLCEDVEAVEADEETQETQGPEKPDGLKMLSHVL
ncbi:hypothetical protein PHYSODRAFT_342773 [Phytophthora sojae]|uniref:Uncharacterized protein n=1 Tax=Phytophthora sojae (strain P6497) TaxID=1094619 RepID=G5AHK5_PHYSP|nr:hypothetical protein PHYSODRAFT_342773 [Phytophthora sojae]EGZ04926.1 hypothetical protein PHYSODRAFT_342773 [Phytophthora sojae]|eukprot:XP_009539556.1 hypothetical protein PHYSODRAFT_342773 [Phytophthora sojae]